MDFLTRLAQRLTGDLPRVQPRLPLLFEPAARPAPGLEQGGETAISGVREVGVQTAPPHSTRLATISPMPSARQMAPESLDPLRPPVSMPAQAELSPYPAPPRLALEVTGDISGSPSHETMAREISQPAAQLAPPRRAVKVTIRPAAATNAPPVSTVSRRGAITFETPGKAKPGQVGTTDEHPQGPPTVHVHIGRIDVRAVMPPTAPPRPAAPPAAPRSTLEDYLSGRKGGSQP